MAKRNGLPAPIAIDCRTMNLETMLELEWLVTNRLGAYASGSVPGTATRRYHGLLIAPTLPPVGRQVVVANVLEQLVVGEKVVDLSTFRFAGATHPEGYVHLVQFVHDIAPTWTFQFQDVIVTKQVILAEQTPVAAVRYRVESAEPVGLRLRPFVALRDFHGMRQPWDPHELVFSSVDGCLKVEDRAWKNAPAYLRCDGAAFRPEPQWWHGFQYDADRQRGQDGTEDLYSPGWFEVTPAGGAWTQFAAGIEPVQPVDFEREVDSRRRRRRKILAAVGEVDELTQRLAAATDDFVVTRASTVSATTVAGYHWFGDWGRDTYISMPGLTLLTGRHAQAMEILRTFTAAMRNGMIPNLFDDYGGEPHYNSIDASLWYVLAVDRYLRATGDAKAWAREFMRPVETILRAYHDGTDFGIRADGDGLIAGGSAETQLTWMDAKFAGQAMTPRDGKVVEINALYLEALHIMADRCRGVDEACAKHFAAEAKRVAQSFARAFWFAEGGYLYDYVGPLGPDRSIRPNQVIAIALLHCPLSLEQQRSVLRVAREHLLTPAGLRTLSPHDPRYHGQYGGTWEARDRAYHQGTVWPWLMGHMVQAHLKLEGFSAQSRAEADAWLRPFEAHLRQAGIGQVSEIFDGSAPHGPRGCIAQAWSVAELLRAKLMIQRGELL